MKLINSIKLPKMSILSKLFLLISAVSLINILSVTIFGSAMLEGFYRSNKKRELAAAEKSVAGASDAATLYNVLDDIERQNNTIIIFSLYGSSATLDYFTLGTNSGTSSSALTRIDAYSEIKRLVDSSFFSYLAGAPKITESVGTMTLYSAIGDSSYIIISTPLEYIASTSRAAMDFFTLLSGGTFVLGLVLAYFISAKISRPIKEITQVAENAAALDFSRRLSIRSGDEIGVLAESVNTMTEQIRQSIDVLQRDLAREEQTNKIRREFIANVSHDFKTPLSLIYAYAEAARDGGFDDQTTADYCNTILEQSENMSELITRLLSLSRVESGMLEISKTPFSLREVAESVVYNARLLAEKAETQVEISVDPELIANADYKQITGVATNLYENALKYASGEKKICIKSEVAGEKIKLSVVNTAAHLSEDDLESLFDSFYRADKSRTSDVAEDKIKVKSYGIGLAIVKGIAEAHGERCGVRNSWLGGQEAVEFWITLERFE